MTARACLALVALTAACRFNPTIHDGEFRCGAGMSCPAGQSCGSDGICRIGGALGDASVSPDAAPSCTPLLCETQNKNCGQYFNGCETVSCGTCELGTCAGGGMSNVCGTGGVCMPKTCADVGDRCGKISDGCTDVLDCRCTAPQVCGIYNSRCCTPVTCTAGECGRKPDGCGGIAICTGTCGTPQSCGGGGTANACGGGILSSCVPTTCVKQMKNCGKISDGCSDVLDCGTCMSPRECGGNGIANVCG